jgi:hypothetical protein
VIGNLNVLFIKQKNKTGKSDFLCLGAIKNTHFLKINLTRNQARNMQIRRLGDLRIHYSIEIIRNNIAAGR